MSNLRVGGSASTSVLSVLSLAEKKTKSSDNVEERKKQMIRVVIFHRLQSIEAIGVL